MKLRTTRAAYNLLHEGSLALAQMEANGFRVDVSYLDKAIVNIKAQIAQMEDGLKQDVVWKKWKKTFGMKTKMGNREQLHKVIFGKMGYETKKDRRSDIEKLLKRMPADEAAFDHIDLPFVKNYFGVQKLKKALSTYLYGIRREVVNDYVHPNINLNIAASIRSTIDNPNIQNQPIRNPVMAEIIRRCYIPSPGNYLIEVDYAQLEVRIASCYCRDPHLMAYIKNPKSCMHRDTAMEMFILKEDQVGRKSTRDSAKNQFVFPEFYGSIYPNIAPEVWDAMERRNFTVVGSKVRDGKYKGHKLYREQTIREHLAEQGITKLGKCEVGEEPRKGSFEYHLKQVEKSLWKRFSVYAQWKKSYYQKYLNNGGFMMYSGFAITEYLRRNEVVNYPIQGFAFHCLLAAIIEITKRLAKYGMRSRLVAEIHDCIVGDVVPKELDDFINICKEVMTEFVPKLWKQIIVPLDVEVEVVNPELTWYDKKEWKEDENHHWILPPEKKTLSFTDKRVYTSDDMKYWYYPQAA